jgi:hypothetical protein
MQSPIGLLFLGAIAYATALATYLVERRSGP